MNKLDDKFKNAGSGEKIKKKRKTIKIMLDKKKSIQVAISTVRKHNTVIKNE